MSTLDLDAAKQAIDLFTDIAAEAERYTDATVTLRITGDALIITARRGPAQRAKALDWMTMLTSRQGPKVAALTAIRETVEAVRNAHALGKVGRYD